MSPGVTEHGVPQVTERGFDVIEACQRWLALDFPDQTDTEPGCTTSELSEGENGDDD